MKFCTFLTSLLSLKFYSLPNFNTDFIQIDNDQVKVKTINESLLLSIDSSGEGTLKDHNITNSIYESWNSHVKATRDDLIRIGTLDDALAQDYARQIPLVKNLNANSIEHQDSVASTFLTEPKKSQTFLDKLLQNFGVTKDFQEIDDLIQSKDTFSPVRSKKKYSPLSTFATHHLHTDSVVPLSTLKSDRIRKGRTKVLKRTVKEVSSSSQSDNKLFSIDAHFSPASAHSAKSANSITSTSTSSSSSNNVPSTSSLGVTTSSPSTSVNTSPISQITTLVITPTSTYIYTPPPTTQIDVVQPVVEETESLVSNADADFMMTTSTSTQFNVFYTTVNAPSNGNTLNGIKGSAHLNSLGYRVNSGIGYIFGLGLGHLIGFFGWS